VYVPSSLTRGARSSAYSLDDVLGTNWDCSAVSSTRGLSPRIGLAQVEPEARREPVDPEQLLVEVGSHPAPRADFDGELGHAHQRLPVCVAGTCQSEIDESLKTT
jgi:hypothetical protein